MKKIRFTKLSKYLLCSLVLVFLVGLLVFIDSKNDLKKYDLKDDEPIINEEVLPVIEQSSTIIERPYLNKDVKILKNYYDYTASSEEQENSIIYYESTYMPNYAVLYGGVDSFEIVSVLDGTVTSIKEDGLLGNIIEIKHENDLISVYQSVKDITVSENQVVKQGEVIATSGTSNLNKDLKNHLLFEMLYKGEIVNPEKYYSRDIRSL